MYCINIEIIKGDKFSQRRVEGMKKYLDKRETEECEEQTYGNIKLEKEEKPRSLEWESTEAKSCAVERAEVPKHEIFKLRVR